MTLLGCGSEQKGQGRAGLEVPGDVDDDDALIAVDKKEQLQQLSALVVERCLPPAFDNEFGNEDGDLTIKDDRARPSGCTRRVAL